MPPGALLPPEDAVPHETAPPYWLKAAKAFVVEETARYPTPAGAEVGRNAPQEVSALVVLSAVNACWLTYSAENARAAFDRWALNYGVRITRTHGFRMDFCGPPVAPSSRAASAAAETTSGRTSAAGPSAETSWCVNLRELRGSFEESVGFLASVSWVGAHVDANL